MKLLKGPGLYILVWNSRLYPRRCGPCHGQNVLQWFLPNHHFKVRGPEPLLQEHVQTEASVRTMAVRSRQLFWGWKATPDTYPTPVWSGNSFFSAFQVKEKGRDKKMPCFCQKCRRFPAENKTHCMPTFRCIYLLSGISTCILPVSPLFTRGTLEYKCKW